MRDRQTDRQINTYRYRQTDWQIQTNRLDRQIQTNNADREQKIGLFSCQYPPWGMVHQSSPYDCIRGTGDVGSTVEDQFFLSHDLLSSEFRGNQTQWRERKRDSRKTKERERDSRERIWGSKEKESRKAGDFNLIWSLCPGDDTSVKTRWLFVRILLDVTRDLLSMDKAVLSTQNGFWGLQTRAEFNYRMSPRGTEREPGLGWMRDQCIGVFLAFFGNIQHADCWLRKHIHYEWALNGYSQPKIYNYNRNYNH